MAALAGMLHRAGPIEAAVGAILMLLTILALKISPTVRNIFCGPLARPETRDTVWARAAPTGPLPGQALPPCDYPGEAKLGGCWMAAREPHGAQTTGCLSSKTLYEIDGTCWLPMYPKSQPRVPSAADVRVIPL